jgi:hypothetical protein
MKSALIPSDTAAESTMKLLFTLGIKNKLCQFVETAGIIILEKANRNGAEKMSWIYHGRDNHQCYYEASCLVCFVRLFFWILFLGHRIKREEI